MEVKNNGHRENEETNTRSVRQRESKTRANDSKRVKKISRKAQMNLYRIFEWIMIALGTVGVCIGQNEAAMLAFLVCGQLRIEERLEALANRESKDYSMILYSLLSLCEEDDTADRIKKEIKKEERRK